MAGRPHDLMRPVRPFGDEQPAAEDTFVTTLASTGSH
jgi:hypothetical protein